MTATTLLLHTETTQGRGDSFTATTTCALCGRTRTFHLADDGSYSTAFSRAERSGRAHQARVHAATTA
jgi:hypothetical protein